MSNHTVFYTKKGCPWSLGIGEDLPLLATCGLTLCQEGSSRDDPSGTWSLVTAGNLAVLKSKGCSYKFVISRKFLFLIRANEPDLGRASTSSIWGSKSLKFHNSILLILFAATTVAKLGQDLVVAWLSGKRDLYVCACKYVMCIWLYITHKIYQMQKYILYIHVLSTAVSISLSLSTSTTTSLIFGFWRRYLKTPIKKGWE